MGVCVATFVGVFVGLCLVGWFICVVCFDEICLFWVCLIVDLK